MQVDCTFSFHCPVVVRPSIITTTGDGCVRVVDVGRPSRGASECPGKSCQLQHCSAAMHYCNRILDSIKAFSSSLILIDICITLWLVPLLRYPSPNNQAGKTQKKVIAVVVVLGSISSSGNDRVVMNELKRSQSYHKPVGIHQFNIVAKLPSFSVSIVAEASLSVPKYLHAINRSSASVRVN